MEHLWFQLPGASRFVEQVAGNIESGRNVIVRAPLRIVPPIGDALRLRLADSGRAWRVVPPSSDDEQRTPLEMLRETYVAAEHRTSTVDLSSLARCVSFRGMLIWGELAIPSDAAAWCSFLSKYSEACRGSADGDHVVFCLCGPHAPMTLRDDVMFACMEWKGEVTNLDVWSFVRHRRVRGSGDPWYDELAEAVIAELAAFDADLAEYLVHKSLPDLLDPLVTLPSYASDQGWSQSNANRPSWQQGQEGYVDGRMVIHPALGLLTGDSKVIMGSLWRAQARSLFPLLERLRLWIVGKASAQLRPPFTVFVGSEKSELLQPDDLELGQLAYFLRFSPWGRDLELLAKMRHRLAHLQPVPASELLGRQFRQILTKFRAWCDSH